MINAIQVAKQLLYVAFNDIETDFLCNMRLQKLLYYVQGWSLALRKRRAFPEAIHAWVDGPVVPEVYSAFRDHGNHPIWPIETPDIAEEDQIFVKRIWEHYRQFSAWQLRQMTHHELPWRLARAGIDPNAKSSAPLSVDVMREYFESIDIASNYPNLPPERIAESVAQIERGETISLSELISVELRN